jgi:hypothetical protein
MLMISLVMIKSDISDYNPRFQDGVELVCRRVDFGNSPPGYCKFLNKATARAYFADTFSVYSPGIPMTMNEQALYAEYNSEVLKGSSSTSPESCALYLQYFSCNSVFPQCVEQRIPVEASNTPAYYQPCKLQCDLVNRYCDFEVPLDCSGYLDVNCGMQSPPGMFALQGGWAVYKSLPPFYIAILVAWLSFTVWWNVRADIEGTLPLSRMLRPLPVLKVAVVVLCVTFWYTCESWMLCSFWISVFVSNCQLLYASAAMLAFCQISMGCGLSQPSMSEPQRKSLLLLLTIFYLINSALLVVKATISLRAFWITSALAYGVCYGYIVYNALNTIAVFHLEVTKLDATETGIVTPATEDLVHDGMELRQPEEEEEGVGLNPIVVLGFSPFDRGYQRVLSGARCLLRWCEILFGRSEELSQHLHRWRRGGPGVKEAVVYQFYLRRDMYIAFLVMVLLNMATELWAHSLERDGQDGDFATVVTLYECTNFATVVYALLVAVSWIFCSLFYSW